MEMDFVGDSSTGPKQLKKNCIREQVAEVQKRDRKIYCPSSLTHNSEEYNRDVNINASLLENNVADHVVGNDVIANNLNDENLESASREMTDPHFQNENFVYEDTVAAINDRPQDAVSDHDAVNNVNDDENNNFDESTATGNNSNMVINNEVGNTINGGPSVPVSTELNGPNFMNEERVQEYRNGGRKKLQKHRLVDDIYDDIGGCFYVEISEDSDEFSIDSEDDSEDDTLNTMKKKKGVRLSCKKRGALKAKRTHQAVKPNLAGAKRTEHVSEGSCSKDSELGSTSRNGLRKNKTDRLEMQVTNRRKRSIAEIIMCENSSAASLDGQKKTCGTQQDSLLSDRNEINSETAPEDVAREILKLQDGSRRHCTEEENRSQNAQLVQPTKAISNNIEIASGSSQKQILESSAFSDNEMMVASIIIKLSAEVNKKVSSSSAIKQPIVSKGKEVYEMDGNVTPALGSSLPQGKQNDGIVCVMNRNPAEFSPEEAEKYMRGG